MNDGIEKSSIFFKIYADKLSSTDTALNVNVVILCFMWCIGDVSDDFSTGW